MLFVRSCHSRALVRRILAVPLHIGVEDPRRLHALPGSACHQMATSPLISVELNPDDPQDVYVSLSTAFQDR